MFIPDEFVGSLTTVEDAVELQRPQRFYCALNDLILVRKEDSHNTFATEHGTLYTGYSYRLFIRGGALLSAVPTSVHNNIIDMNNASISAVVRKKNLALILDLSNTVDESQMCECDELVIGDNEFTTRNEKKKARHRQ